jgi:hypothetical protein
VLESCLSLSYDVTANLNSKEVTPERGGNAIGSRKTFHIRPILKPTIECFLWVVVHRSWHSLHGCQMNLRAIPDGFATFLPDFVTAYRAMNIAGVVVVLLWLPKPSWPHGRPERCSK